VNGKIKYEFTTKIWQHEGVGGWHFVSLPQHLAKEIRENLKSEEQGWGRLKATARVGNSQWETALWFDTKHQTYLLPLKAEIRKKEKLEKGNDISISVWM
jgi:hypothetical protein